MKFKVDESACIGCGACTCICDKVFEMSDDGYAVAKDEKVTDKETLDEATEAMEGCPTSAITEEKED